MWIPFTGLMISMLGVPAGSYDWVELPLGAQISFVGIAFFGAVALIMTVAAPMASGRANAVTLSNGLPADAIILKLSDTGTTVNQNPMVRMLLEVRPPNEPSFQAEVERLISRLEIPQVQPGAAVRVKYDPETRAVAIVADDDISTP